MPKPQQAMMLMKAIRKKVVLHSLLKAASKAISY